MDKPITFIADKVKLNGPKLDGTFTISFDTGDYAWNLIKDLPNLNGESIVVSVSKYTK